MIFILIKNRKYKAKFNLCVGFPIRRSSTRRAYSHVMSSLMAFRFTDASCLSFFFYALVAAPFSFFSAASAMLRSLAATFSASLLFFIIHLLALSV
jgi:hypothetical protein